MRSRKNSVLVYRDCLLKLRSMYLHSIHEGPEAAEYRNP